MARRRRYRYGKGLPNMMVRYGPLYQPSGLPNMWIPVPSPPTPRPRTTTASPTVATVYPGAPPPASSALAAPDGGLPFPGYLTPAQIQQQAETAAAPYNALIGTLQAGIPQLQSLGQQGQAGVAGAYAGVANDLKAIGPAIGTAYNQAAADQTTFGQGYAGGLGNAITQNAATINAQLERIGAPAGQMVPGEQRAADASAVLAAQGGNIPAAMYAKQGGAYATAAGFLPGVATAQGQIAGASFLQSVNDRIVGVQQQLQQAAIDAFQAKLARGEALSDQQLQFFRDAQVQAQQAKQDAVTQATQAYNAGLVSPRELGQALGLPNWQTLPDTRGIDQLAQSKVDASLSKLTGYLTDEYGNPIFGKNKRPIPLPGNTNVAAYDPALSAQVGYLVDRNRNPILDASKKRIPYTPTGTATAPRYDPRLSAQLGYLVDSTMKPLLDTKGKRIPYRATGTSTTSPRYDAGLSVQLGYLVDANRQPILDSKGKTIPYRSKTATRVARYDAGLSAQVGYLVDVNRNPILDSHGKHIPYTAKPAGAGSPSYQHVTLANGKPAIFDKTTGTFYDPTTHQPITQFPTRTTAKGTVQPKVLTQARQTVATSEQPYWALQSDPHTALTLPQVQGLLRDYNKANNTKLTIADLTSAKDGPGNQDKVGLGQFRPVGRGLTRGDDITGLYLKLVQMGVPGYRAFRMVGSRYPEWQKRHADWYSGKGKAAPSGGNTGASYEAVAPIAKRIGVQSSLVSIWQQAGAKYGVPWQVLAAINKIESNNGQKMGPSSAGAVGWMQFLPSTWAKYGVDADGDGVANPSSPADAIFSAARYLAASGAGTDLRRAVFAYNHADWYVNNVLRLANSYGLSENVA